ncbi:MAG: efflux RND transporter periplasmic adaptor subunit [Opitutaceae bacterium]|nr:efflux RND transporter periplasmic adaptor subunit [Opitutaceae bacterium]
MSSSAVPPAQRPNPLLRIVITLAILAGCTWGGTVAWRHLKPGLFGDKRQEKVPVVKVRTASIAEEIIAVGRLRAVFSTELRSEINGRIVKILAVDGQKMKKDEEVLRLDQQDLLTQIQEIERSIEAAKLRSQRARRDHERLMDLQKRGVVTLKDFEDSRITFSLAENDAAIAEARAANLRDKLTKTVIRAPHDGTLLLRDLTEGQVITGAAAQNGGTLLGEVADLTHLMVRTNINEIDVARIKLGDHARVRVDSMRSVLMSGAVKRIATSALETGSDRTRVFPVDVILEEADERLRPGMSATVMFTLARVDEAIAAPLNAVFSTPDSARYVFLRKGEGFVAHPVEIGIADTRYVQIVSGLQVGDEVARSRPLEFEGDLPVSTLPTAPKARPTKSSGESKSGSGEGGGKPAPTAKSNRAS